MLDKIYQRVFLSLATRQLKVRMRFFKLVRGYIAFLFGNNVLRGDVDGFSGNMLYIAIDNQGNGLFASGFKAISNFFTKGISTSTLAKAPLKRNATFFAGVKLDGIPLKSYIRSDDNRQIA